MGASRRVPSYRTIPHLHPPVTYSDISSPYGITLHCDARNVSFVRVADVESNPASVCSLRKLPFALEAAVQMLPMTAFKWTRRSQKIWVMTAERTKENLALAIKRRIRVDIGHDPAKSLTFSEAPTGRVRAEGVQR